MKIIDGGVCAAQGFTAGSIRSGVKDSRAQDDTAIIFSDCECTAAAVYTMNRVKAAPLYVTMEHLGKRRGARDCRQRGQRQRLRAGRHGERPPHGKGCGQAPRRGRRDDVVVASTGVIGQRLPVECIEQHLPELALSGDGSEKANLAIMTTDTKPKTAAVEFTAGGKTCRLGGICKGSGMIHPNMGTMLSFLTTDCAITHEMLAEALQENVRKTYNRVTVDGDTSTNDHVRRAGQRQGGQRADRVAG